MKCLKVIFIITVICMLLTSCEPPPVDEYPFLNSEEKVVMKDFQRRFGKLQTSLGETTFTFRMIRNESLYSSNSRPNYN